MYRPSSSFEQARAIMTPVRKFVALATPWSMRESAPCRAVVVDHKARPRCTGLGFAQLTVSVSKTVSIV